MSMNILSLAIHFLYVSKHKYIDELRARTRRDPCSIKSQLSSALVLTTAWCVFLHHKTCHYTFRFLQHTAITTHLYHVSLCRYMAFQQHCYVVALFLVRCNFFFFARDDNLKTFTRRNKLEQSLILLWPLCASQISNSSVVLSDAS